MRNQGETDGGGLAFIDWFSGIGGIRIALQKAGFECIAHSEVDPHAIKIYERHWPDCPNLGNMGTGVSVPEILDSLARLRGSRGPMAGAVPSALLLENVNGWRSGGLQRTLADLASIGFDAEWFTVCSCRFGAPHHRERVFVLAYPNEEGEPFGTIHEKVAALPRDAAAVSWPDSPEDVGVDDGIPHRSHRNRLLGNSVVIPVVQWIAQRIVRSL